MFNVALLKAYMSVESAQESLGHTLVRPWYMYSIDKH
jgi:hypothetical protein